MSNIIVKIHKYLMFRRHSYPSSDCCEQISITKNISTYLWSGSEGSEYQAELGTILGAETTAGRRAALPSGSKEWGMGPHQHERAEAEARGLVHLGTCVGTSLTDAEHL